MCEPRGDRTVSAPRSGSPEEIVGAQATVEMGGSSAVIHNSDRLCSSRPNSDGPCARPIHTRRWTMSGCFQPTTALIDLGLTDGPGPSAELMDRRPCRRELPAGDRSIHSGQARVGVTT